MRSNLSGWRPACMCFLCFFIFFLFLKCFWEALYKSKTLLTIRLKNLWAKNRSLRWLALNEKQRCWLAPCLLFLCFFAFYLFLKCFWGDLCKSKLFMTITLKKLWVESSSLKWRGLNDKQLCWLASCLLAFFVFFRIFLVVEVLLRSTLWIKNLNNNYTPNTVCLKQQP